MGFLPHIPALFRWGCLIFPFPLASSSLSKLLNHCIHYIQESLYLPLCVLKNNRIFTTEILHLLPALVALLQLLNPVLLPLSLLLIRLLSLEFQLIYFQRKTSVIGSLNGCRNRIHFITSNLVQISSLLSGWQNIPHSRNPPRTFRAFHSNGLQDELYIGKQLLRLLIRLCSGILIINGLCDTLGFQHIPN